MSSFLTISSPAMARRIFIGRSGILLSGAAVALLAGRDVLAAKAGASKNHDIQILNSALAAELEASRPTRWCGKRAASKTVLDLACSSRPHKEQPTCSPDRPKLGGKAVLAKNKSLSGSGTRTRRSVCFRAN